MILLIDNYDSFTYNLVQLLREAGAEVEVVRNDAATSAELLARNPQGIVLPPVPDGRKAPGCAWRSWQRGPTCRSSGSASGTSAWARSSARWSTARRS